MSVIDLINSPWAITPSMLEAIDSIYQSKLQGASLSADELSARLGRPVDNDHKNYEVIDGVAVIPMNGVVAKRANMFSAISGGVSTELIGRDIKKALQDSQVKSILLDVDSPGGSVDGLPELANIIYQGRGQKKIVALGNGLMASAAYWLGSSAAEVYASSSTATIGSIGVVATHREVSQREQSMGVKTTEICAGKYKRIASNYEPLSPDGRADIQSRVDHLYSVFVNTVARNRSVSEEVVLENMAEGRQFIGQQSVDAGLVDGIKSRDELIDFMTSSQIFKSEGIRVKTEENTGQASDSSSVEEVSVESLKKEHPSIVSEIEESAAAAERDRIQGVLSQSAAGCHDLINEMAFDGKSTAGDAAIKVLAKQKESQQEAQAEFENDAPEALDADVSASESGEDAGSPSGKGDAHDIAEKAQALIAKAELEGRTLSAKDAVKKVEVGQ